MDVLVVVHPQTIPLLKVFCESYRYHYRGKGQLIIIGDKSCLGQINAFDLPLGVRVLAKEDILPDHLCYNGYLTQQYFKLFAHEIVSSDHYLIVDDDFLFIRPTTDQIFFIQEKPIWFYQSWGRSGAGVKWKEPTQVFMGIEQPYCFMSNPTYVCSVNIMKKLCSAIKPLEILHQKIFSEFQAYGAFAFANFRDKHCWINNHWGDEVLGGRVNQIPPDYFTLDPSIHLESFMHFHYLAFWSHWSYSETKMKEFFESSR